MRHVHLLDIIGRRFIPIILVHVCVRESMSVYEYGVHMYSVCVYVQADSWSPEEDVICHDAMWRSEDKLLMLILFFHFAGSRNQTQAPNLGALLPNNLVGPCTQFTV